MTSVHAPLRDELWWPLVKYFTSGHQSSSMPQSLA